MPPSTAITTPRDRPPPPPLRVRENSRASITGNEPSVESAWLCGPDSASPINFDRIAQMPHENTAAIVQMNHAGIYRHPFEVKNITLAML